MILNFSVIHGKPFLTSIYLISVSSQEFIKNASATVLPKSVSSFVIFVNPGKSIVVLPMTSLSFCEWLFLIGIANPKVVGFADPTVSPSVSFVFILSTFEVWFSKVGGLNSFSLMWILHYLGKLCVLQQYHITKGLI